MANAGGSYQIIDGEKVLIEATDQVVESKKPEKSKQKPQPEEVNQDAVS